MQHFTDIVFESVNYTREKRKKQSMVLLHLKAIQICLELVRAELILPKLCLLI